MKRVDYAWEHFKFNAEQRLKAFDFFVVLSVFADGGVLTALEKGVQPELLLILGAFVALVATSFLLIDVRSRGLILLSLPALKEFETRISENFRFFTQDEANGGIAKFTVAFRTLFFAQMIFGIGVALYGACLTGRG